jgi:TolB-like protein/tetratricopeptide (TPR) repeat protein
MPAIDPTRLQVQEALDRVVASPRFRSSERMSAFLRFVVQHTLDGGPGPLKEFLIAERVFGRGDSFDPRTDTIVRVEARRLRSKLQKYYQDEGRDDPVVIELAERGYTPTFRTAVQQVGVLPERRRRPWAIAAAATLLALAGLSAWGWRSWPRERVDSVGVLACDNLTGHPEDEPLSSGLAIGILLSLMNVTELRPVDGILFNGSNSVDVRAIADRLGVESVFLCSVQREGRRLLVTARLVNGKDGSLMWALPVDRKIESEIDIQAEIARSIVTALNIHLTSSVDGRLRPETTSDDAHVFYLTGLHFWDRGAGGLRPEELQKSVEYMEKAIAADENYAAAHAGLADALGMLLGFDPNPEILARVKWEARRARDLGGDDSAEGHYAIAGVLASEGKWDEADREFLGAIELKPTFGPARQAYANLLLAPLRRYEEAIDQLNMAANLRPVAAVPKVFLGQALVYAGRFDDALIPLEKALELESDLDAAKATLALAHLGKGSYGQALEQLKTLEHSREFPYAKGLLGYTYARLGRRDDARELVDVLGESPMTAIDVAAIYSGLGETTRAVHALEKAYRSFGPAIAWVSGDPRFRDLDAEPGYDRLLKQIGVQRSG